MFKTNLNKVNTKNYTWPEEITCGVSETNISGRQEYVLVIKWLAQEKESIEMLDFRIKNLIAKFSSGGFDRSKLKIGGSSDMITVNITDQLANKIKEKLNSEGEYFTEIIDVANMYVIKSNTILSIIESRIPLFCCSIL